MPLAVLPFKDGLLLEMKMPGNTEEVKSEEVEVVEQTEVEKNEEVQAAFDRVVNPNKEFEQEVATTELASNETAPALTADQVSEIMAGLARIPKLEKQLNDTGGRYGAMKQSLEQLQQRLTSTGSPVDVEDALKDLKEEFGEDGLYSSLKTAFSKMSAGKTIDPGVIENMVQAKIEATKQAEIQNAKAYLSEVHPTWEQDMQTPEFQEWMASLPEKVRNKVNRSNDPEYAADRLDDFKEWKGKKSAPAEATPVQHKPSKRLINAVLPTNGTKPKPSGDDKEAQVRAAFERAAGIRKR